MTPEERETENRAARIQIRAWREDPVYFVRNQFKIEPDEWQKDALRSYRDNKRTGLVACKGPGKSTADAWCAWWTLACFPDSEGFALSITGDNLKDGLWKELAKWRDKSPLLIQAFTMNSDRIASKDRPKTWWLSARSFPKQADKEQQADTIAGLHADHVFIILDEFGDYPDGVLPAAEGIFANDVWARILVSGNPTKTGGSLHRICTRDAKLWNLIHITGDPDDPKRSPRISMTWAREQIAQWGRDNPWVMANVLGQFPPTSSDKLIGIDVVMAAQARDMPRKTFLRDARLWGLDPARSGNGDEIGFARRQGILCKPIETWRGMDGIQLGNIIAQKIMEAQEANEEPDAIFIDVGGVGSSCVDHLRFLGYGHLIHAIDFGWAAIDNRFYDYRSEMWWKMAEWLKRKPACLPTDMILQAELVEPTMEFRIVSKRTQFKLESKKEMKVRGVESPNRADALCLTFAAPVAQMSKADRDLQNPQVTKVETVYNPYAKAGNDGRPANVKNAASEAGGSYQGVRRRVEVRRDAAPAARVARAQVGILVAGRHGWRWTRPRICTLTRLLIGGAIKATVPRAARCYAEERAS